MMRRVWYLFLLLVLVGCTQSPIDDASLVAEGEPVE